MITLNFGKGFFLFSFLLTSFNFYAQVGIGTTNPTASLDVNGNLRIRQVDESLSTDDTPLVIDANGVVMRELGASQGAFSGTLASNYFTSNHTANAQGIYKIIDFTELIDRGNDFNTTTSEFVAPITGIYEVAITITVFSTSGGGSYVVGLTNPTGQWVMRFSMFGEHVNLAGNSTGIAFSFTGAVQLTQGEAYSFGVSQGLSILSNPVGATGTGIGTYFTIKLVDN